MKKAILIILSFLTGLLCVRMYGGMNKLYKGDRHTSEPYLSGDTFRKYCDHILDIKSSNFDPSKVKTGDIIFLSAFDYNEKLNDKFINIFFEKYHPLIKNKYILLTHNSTVVITEKFKKYCDSEKLFAWFAHNVEYKNPKLIPVPLGLENELWGRKYVERINVLRKCSFDVSKEYLLYMNFSVHTNPLIRNQVYKFFSSKDFCHIALRMDLDSYLSDICKAKFIVSPRGSAPDCHRVWEALYLGAIPVVKKSLLDPVYEDLPILIVDDWSDVTAEFLENKYAEILNTKYKTEKLFIEYWLEVFKTFKKLCRDSQ